MYRIVTVAITLDAGSACCLQGYNDMTLVGVHTIRKRMAGGCMVCWQAVRYLGHITVATIVASSSKVAVCNSTRGDTHRE